ncbi:hypothetical protein SGUI_1659 [Serinicoccus hydrothermalis]|uniref:Imm-5-like domain-containing protein n=1 Tax=Serinicoccus hydrothermalis TaxID=1758689 RepID=A0A1B1NCF9_9MICO|nr:hypothetical protein [Serinicoccus hydrothermalis]ANS79055.1 hypothetical protein SGUI_1659 [Serinicoccus hydrothermalis]
MILHPVRDPRLITTRRGGTLTDVHHQLLARWAASCAEHVLALFEVVAPEDSRPREAIAAARAWADGRMRMMDSRALAGHAMGAARPLSGAPRFAAYAAGQAAAVPHVAEHDLGAAAYAIRAAMAAVEPAAREEVRLRERDRQRAQVPEELRRLVIEDQARRDHLCWGVFGD